MVKRKDQGRKRLISIHQILVGLGSTGSYVLAPWLLKGVGQGWKSWAGAQDRISEDRASTPGLRSSMDSGQALVCLEGS